MTPSNLEPDQGELHSEINMIPLIDVMLVLLIVFIVTVPVITHSIPVQLPRAATEASAPQPQAVRLSVDAQGGFHWNDAAVPDAELVPRLQALAQQVPQPPLHLHGDAAARYERVALALAAAQRAGIERLVFITQP
jgi:biopolymer transport protein ExbD